LAGSVVVLGHETRGAMTTQHSRGVGIPMPGTAESINVAQAATVLLFEGVRRCLLGAPENQRLGAEPMA
jgi:tRNA G18 (ribose-2'-O)-methylase SpoU